MSVLQSVQQATAMVLIGDERGTPDGTAWLITPRFALTAAHVVTGRGRGARLHFPVAGFGTGFEVETLCTDLDVALLRLANGTDSLNFLRWASLPRLAGSNLRWLTRGFPALDPAGTVVRGTVDNVDHLIPEADVRGLQLKADAAPTLTLGGLSGAPIAIDRDTRAWVVGFVRDTPVVRMPTTETIDNKPVDVVRTIPHCVVYATEMGATMEYLTRKSTEFAEELRRVQPPQASRLLFAASQLPNSLSGGLDQHRQILEGLLRGEPGSPPIVRHRGIARLHAEIAARPTGITAVTAPAGFGKSVLAAQFIESRSALCAFISEKLPIRDEVSIAGHLVAQALARDDDSERSGVLADAVTTTAQKWSELVGSRASESPRIVVIDGVDEAAHPGDFVRRLVSAQMLPTGLHLVLLGRPGLWTEALTQFPQDVATVTLGEELQHTELRSFIAQCLESVPQGVIVPKQTEALVATLVERSEGSFLYVRMLFDELLRRREWTDVLVHQQRLPVGLANLIEGTELGRTFRPDAPLGAIGKAVLSLLASAFAPVKPEWLAAVASSGAEHCDSAFVEGAFRVLLERFFNWPTDEEPQSAGITFSQASFRQYVAEKVSRARLQPHAWICAYYRARLAGSAPLDRYGVLHAAMHVLEHKGPLAAVGEIRDPGFVNAALTVDPTCTLFHAGLTFLSRKLHDIPATVAICRALWELNLFRGSIQRVESTLSGPLVAWMLRNGFASQDELVSIAKSGKRQWLTSASVATLNEQQRWDLVQWTLMEAARPGQQLQTPLLGMLASTGNADFRKRTLDRLTSAGPLTRFDSLRALWVDLIGAGSFPLVRDTLVEVQDGPWLTRELTLIACELGNDLPSAIAQWLLPQVKEASDLDTRRALIYIHGALPDSYAPAIREFTCRQLATGELSELDLGDLPMQHLARDDLTPAGRGALANLGTYSLQPRVHSLPDEVAREAVLEIIRKKQVAAPVIAARRHLWSDASVAKILEALRERGATGAFDAACFGPARYRETLTLSQVDGAIAAHGREPGLQFALCEGILMCGSPDLLTDAVARLCTLEEEADGYVGSLLFAGYAKACSDDALRQLGMWEKSQGTTLFTHAHREFAERASRAPSVSPELAEHFAERCLAFPNDVLADEVAAAVCGGSIPVVTEILAGRWPENYVTHDEIIRSVAKAPIDATRRNASTLATAIASGSLRAKACADLLDVLPSSHPLRRALEDRLRKTWDADVRGVATDMASRPLIEPGVWLRLILRLLEQERIEIDDGTTQKLRLLFRKPRLPDKHVSWLALARRLADPSAIVGLVIDGMLDSDTQKPDGSWLAPFLALCDAGAAARIANGIAHDPRMRQLRLEQQMCILCQITSYLPAPEQRQTLSAFLRALPRWTPTWGPECYTVIECLSALTPHMTVDELRLCSEGTRAQRIFLPLPAFLAKVIVERALARHGVHGRADALAEVIREMLRTRSAQFPVSTLAWCTGLGADMEIAEEIVRLLKTSKPDDSGDPVISFLSAVPSALAQDVIERVWADPEGRENFATHWTDYRGLTAVPALRELTSSPEWPGLSTSRLVLREEARRFDDRLDAAVAQAEAITKANTVSSLEQTAHALLTGINASTDPDSDVFRLCSEVIEEPTFFEDLWRHAGVAWHDGACMWTCRPPRDPLPAQPWKPSDTPPAGPAAVFSVPSSPREAS